MLITTLTSRISCGSSLALEPRANPSTEPNRQSEKIGGYLGDIIQQTVFLTILIEISKSWNVPAHGLEVPALRETIEAKSVDQLSQIGDCSHDNPPRYSTCPQSLLLGMFSESAAPLDGKVLTESVALLANQS